MTEIMTAMAELSPMTMILLVWLAGGVWVILRGGRAMRHPVVAERIEGLTQTQRMQLVVLMIIATILFWPFVLILMIVMRRGQ